MQAFTVSAMRFFLGAVVRLRFNSMFHGFCATCVIVFVSFSGSLATAQSTDFGGYRPHYQGHGVNTTGGRGGSVCRVTSLSDTAWPAVPSTLRYCVEDTRGPRFVIFEISGTINLAQGPLFVRNPYITIAGQSAPSPGIVIRGPGVIIDTHDVVIQHVRVRVGAISGDPMALWVRDDATRVVIDHVSLSWSVWTALALTSATPGHPVGEVTVIDSIIAEGLGCSGMNGLNTCDPQTYPQHGSANSRAILVGDSWGHAQPKLTLLRNISANNNDRNPEIFGRTYTLMVNNVIYNPSLTPLSVFFYHDANKAGPLFSVVQGNVLIPGPTTPGHNGYVAPEYPEEGPVKMVRVLPTTTENSLIYLDGNYYSKDCNGTACLANPAAQWMLAKDYMADWNGVNIRATTPPFSVASLPLSSALPYGQVETYVKANAGARPLDRDAVDTRVINEITSRTGAVPNSPSDRAGVGTSADGFPVLAVNRRALTVPQNPNEVVDSVGRTRIEAWLETFARELEPASAAKTVSPPAAPYNVRLRTQ
jgi:hypothetical protein